MSTTEAEKRADAIAKNRARPFDLTDHHEISRLFRDVSGYLRTCRRHHHGTDFAGRDYAIAAIEFLAGLEKLAAPDLLSALTGLLNLQCHSNDRAHWVRERDLGNESAVFVLAAMDAIAMLAERSKP